MVGMICSDFNLKTAVDTFGLTEERNADLFAAVEPNCSGRARGHRLFPNRKSARRTRRPAMHRAALIACLVAPLVAPAQAPQFRWAAGQTLTYRVSQTTTAVETAGGKSATTTNQLDLVKQWAVTDVTGGVATLQMSLTELKLKTVPPAGETLTFDSTDAAKCHPQLRDEMRKFLNVPLTIVKLDAAGKLIEVKQSQFGPANRLEADLPFKLTLPPTALVAGTAWQRTFTLKLDPPQGTGESYTATQKYAVKAVSGPAVTVAVTTAFDAPPESPTERIALLPWQPEGECVFDTAAGRLVSVQFRVRRDLAGHDGDGSKYAFSSDYREQLVEAK